MVRKLDIVHSFIRKDAEEMGNSQSAHKISAQDRSGAP